MKRLMFIGAIGLVGVSAVVACGDDDDDTTADVQEANAEFCQDLVAYGTSLQSLVALDASTATKDDYDSAVDQLRSSREAMVSSGQDLSDAEWTNLQAQVDTLTDQLRDAPDDVAVQTILADAQAQATTVQASVATLNTAVCTTANPTATTG